MDTIKKEMSTRCKINAYLNDEYDEQLDLFVISYLNKNVKCSNIMNLSTR